LRFDTSSLHAQGGQRRNTYFNIRRDIPGKNELPKLIQGVRFSDGIEVKDEAEKNVA